MKRRVHLPKDELPHRNQAIEWWYFNGFLEGKQKYAFMTCLFKADINKINLDFLRLPLDNLYFSHTILFNLSNGKISKEVLPFVRVFNKKSKRKNLFLNYFSPLASEKIYKIISKKEGFEISSEYFNLNLKKEKKALYEGGTGYLDLGKKSTYYYSYPRLSVKGSVKNDKVTGIAWHDRQWSTKGFMRDSWLWFSFQLEDGTDIVCFDYNGIKMATISHPDNRQETVPVRFIQQKNKWKSKITGVEYKLNWKVKIKDLEIETIPHYKKCEMNFGPIHYWEGPVKIKINGKDTNSKGFMEYLAEPKEHTLKDILLHKFGIR